MLELFQALYCIAVEILGARCMSQSRDYDELSTYIKISGVALLKLMSALNIFSRLFKVGGKNPILCMNGHYRLI